MSIVIIDAELGQPHMREILGVSTAPKIRGRETTCEGLLALCTVHVFPVSAYGPYGSHWCVGGLRLIPVRPCFSYVEHSRHAHLQVSEPLALYVGQCFHLVGCPLPGFSYLDWSLAPFVSRTAASNDDDAVQD